MSLGLMYSNGQGVPQDIAHAYKWLHLVSSRASGDAHATFARVRDVLAARMTPGQVAEGRKQAQEWAEAYERRMRQ